MISFLTYLLLFFVPLIVIPGISLRFEPPKVLATELLIALLAVYVIASGKFALKRVNKLFVGLLEGLFLLSVLHLIISPTEQNLFGNVFRLQGTVLFWHLLVFAIIAQNCYFSLSHRYIYTAGFIGILIGGLIFGSNSAGRWIGSLGEPNALGAVIVMMFPFLFLGFKQIWVRVLLLFGVLIVLNFAQSRSAMIGLGLELLFIFLLRFFKERYFLASFICLALLILSLVLPILERQYFLMTNTNPLNYRFEDRAEIWEVSLNAGFKSPIFGSGLESIQEKIKTTAQEMNVNAQYQVIDSSHNILLDFWIWGGIVALILLLTLIVLAIKNMVKKKMMLEMSVFLGLLAVLAFNPTTVSVLVGFWWIIGRSFANSKTE